MIRSAVLPTTLVLGFTLATLPAAAQDDAGELAKKLSNPVASLISFPIQINPDVNLGPADAGEKLTINIQPVIPTSIGEHWNLISRIITPVVFVDDIFPGSGSEFGLGDMTPSFFLSPKHPTKQGLIWGAGPVFLLPTATDDLLGADQWGLGPTFVVLRQSGPWTAGALANHIERVAGDERVPDISNSFLQPFLSYAYPSGLSYAVNTESTYDWRAEQWTIPINVTASAITKMGGQLMSLLGGLRYYVESPTGGPEWGLRVQLTLLYPK